MWPFWFKSFLCREGVGVRMHKGKECRGKCGTSEGCTLSRARPGKPIVMSKACVKCGEWRCRSHCKCSRNQELTGRNMARGAGVKSKPSSSSSTAPPQPVAPVGRGPAPSCQLLAGAKEMLEMACKEIESSSEVEAASFIFDNHKLHAVFLKRLNGRKPFRLNLYVDREQLGGKVLKSGDKPGGSKKMKSRVAELRHNGAAVYVCNGKGHLGSYHPKGLVIDRRYLYCGSPNLTDKSLENEEWPLRCTGEVVGQVLARLGLTRETHPLWDGKPL